MDTIILGKRTFEWTMKQDTEEYPHKYKEGYVFTKSSIEDAEDVNFINEDVNSRG